MAADATTYDKKFNAQRGAQRAGLKPGKRKAIIEGAQAGALPAAPDFSKPTHARFRAKLAKLVALAEAGDVEAGLSP